MVEIYQMNSRDDIKAVQKLLLEYLSWAADQARDLNNRDVDIQEMLRHSITEMSLFTPPSGRLLIASVDGERAGMGSMKRIRDDACVIKRMYVRPGFRGRGIGRSLLDRLIQAAKEVGYAKILLDSANFMDSAQPLYRSAGFEEIDPYPEAEMPEEFHDHMIFMELKL